MSLLESNNRNLIIALSIVICSGIMLPLLNFGLNLGILIQILQYLTIWAIITVIPSVIFHYAPMRAEYQFKRFSILIGFCMLPYLVQNILKPLLEGSLTVHLDGVWNLDVIKQSTSSWVLQAGIFLYSALPAITICLIIVFVGISMNKVYDIDTEKAFLIAIPIVLSATLMTTFLQKLLILVF